MEIDFIRPVDAGSAVIVSELNWGALSPREREQRRAELVAKWHQSKLARRFQVQAVEVLSFEDFVEHLADLQEEPV